MEKAVKYRWGEVRPGVLRKYVVQPTNRELFIHSSKLKCEVHGDHLSDTDKDGYCWLCGEQ